MHQTQPHPPDDDLRAFVLGKLVDPLDEQVESHLAGCSHCQARAAELPASDTLVELLAGATPIDERTRCPEQTPSEFPSTRCWDGPAPGAADAPPGLADHPRYQLLRPLGGGGMGVVWLAEHSVMGRLVALKVIRPEFLARSGAVERFRREVRAAAALQHPNIVTAHDAEEAGGTHLLVMEYVEGETLLDTVRRGPLPVAEACRAARDAARGLAHAHAAGLTHRDVKPGNLIRTTNGTTKVLDFGLVGFGGSDATGLTGENVVMGTPDYIAPEQAEDPRTADARSDVYALGCTLYHLLAGRVPFREDSAVQKIDAHRSREANPIPGVPAALAAVVRRMMAKRPGDRYQTATAVADALEPFCVEPVAEPVGSGRLTQSAPARRRWAIAAGLLLGLVGLGAAGAVYKIQRDNEVIEIKTDDPDIEVVMKRNGELVRIVDTKTGQAWELDTKKMRLRQDGSELSIDLPGKEPLVIRRHGDVAVTIQRVPTTPPAPVEPVKPIRPAHDPSKTIPPAGVWIEAHQRFTGHTMRVRNVTFSADGKTVYSASDDGTVRAWDRASGKQTATFAHDAAVFGLTLADDGKTLVTNTQKQLRAWDLATGKEQAFQPAVTGDLTSCAASPDGKWVATASTSGAIRIYDAAKRKLVTAWPAEHGQLAYYVAWSPDGALLAHSTNGGLVVRQVKTGEVVLWKGTHGTGWVEIGFSPDGKTVGGAMWGGEIYLADYRSGKVVGNWTGGEFAGRFRFAPDGRLVTGGRGQFIDVWSPAGARLAELKGHTEQVIAIAVSPDGKWLASGSEDKTVRVWKLPEQSAPK